MNISTTTKLFGSFSEAPGNNGAKFFNEAFFRNNIDAIYIPVKCSNTKDVVEAIEIMNFQGASLSIPHKVSVLPLLDELDETAKTIGAVNTVVRKNDILIGHNTDWFGVYSVLRVYNLKHLFIYGNGGFSKAVQYACANLNIDITVLGRSDSIPTEGMVFNATPIEINQSNVLDARPSKPLGFQVFTEQAKVQYQLYTGTPYV